MYAGVGKETSVAAAGRLMDGLYTSQDGQNLSGRVYLYLFIFGGGGDLRPMRDCVCPELKYLHLLATIDFPPLSEGLAARPKSFLDEAAEARR